MAVQHARVNDLAEFQVLCAKLMSDGLPVGFDVETGYLGPDTKKGALDIASPSQFVCGFSITNSTKWARYVPVAHDYGPNLPEYETWEAVKPVLETLPVIAHNAKFEMLNLRGLARKERGPRIEMNLGADTMLDAYVLSEWKSVGLKPMVKAVFGHEMTVLTDLFAGATEKQKKEIRYNTLDLTPEVIAYVCEDAAWCLALYYEIGEKAKLARGFMHDLEHMICGVLTDMEEAGVAVDWAGIEKQRLLSEPFKAKMEASIKKGLSEWAGRDMSAFNVNSPKQLRELLYKELGLATTRMTGTAEKKLEEGAEKWEVMSTDTIAMETLSRKHPVVKKILELREVNNLAKRLDTWLTDFNTSHDGRVHASYGQTIVGSGRFAANDPAIQQCPKDWGWTPAIGYSQATKDAWAEIVERGQPGRHYWTGNFRDYIVAADGTYFLGYDYSQIELRVLAGESREPALLDAFNNDKDIHTITAATMLGKTPSQIDPKTERPVGKTMNFALLYGMGAKSLAERLGISLERARELYSAYFSGFSLITDWMEKAKREGKANGYVETHWKRKYTVWEYQSTLPAVYNKAERVCVNVPIQGGAADYMKIAMVRARKACQDRGWWGDKVKLVLNLHDALMFECDNSLDPREVRAALQTAVVFEVPNFPKIVADWEIGQKWGSSTRWRDEEVVFTQGVWQVGEAAEVDREDDELSEEDEEAVRTSDVQVPRETIPRVSPTDPKTLVVEVEELHSDRFDRFMALLWEFPGDNEVVFKTDEGEIPLVPRTSLDLHDRGRFSLALGGAKVYYPKDKIDLGALAEGLVL